MKAQAILLVLVCLLGLVFAASIPNDEYILSLYGRKHNLYVTPSTVNKRYVNPDPDYIHINSDHSKVTLYPHGLNSDQDWINLQWIFNTFKHFDLKLAEGIYKISQLLEISGFQGTIKGQGVHKTFLTLQGPDVNGQPVFGNLNEDQTERLYPSGVASGIWAHPDNGSLNDWQSRKLSLTMKHLTINFNGLASNISYFDQNIRTIWAFLIVTDSIATYTTPGGDVSNYDVTFSDVDFYAPEVSYILDGVNRTNSQVAAGVIYYGRERWVPGLGLNGKTENDHYPINAQVLLNHCYFEGMNTFAIGAETFFTEDTGSGYSFPTSPPFDKATFEVKDCDFVNVGNGGNIETELALNILVLGVSGADIVIKDNTFEDVKTNGIVALSDIAEFLNKNNSQFTVKNNYFSHMTGPESGASIRVIDLSFPLTGGNTFYSFNIKDNVFESDGVYLANFIQLDSGYGAIIKDNLFSGNALSGVLIGNFTSSGFPLPVVGCLVKENDFSSLNSYSADIYLGIGSSLNTIVIESSVSYIDHGQYNNIVITP